MKTEKERFDKIYGIGCDLIRDRFFENKAEIELYCVNNIDKIKREFINHFKTICRKALALQAERDKKGEIKYFCICFLQSSMYTRSYDYRLDLYDHNFYGDIWGASDYWKPMFAMKYFDSDIEYLIPKLRQKIPILRNYEIENFKREYIYNYYAIVQDLLDNLIIDESLETEEFKRLKKKDSIIVFFGGYMGKAIMLRK